MNFGQIIKRAVEGSDKSPDTLCASLGIEKDFLLELYEKKTFDFGLVVSIYHYLGKNIQDDFSIEFIREMVESMEKRKEYLDRIIEYLKNASRRSPEEQLILIGKVAMEYYSQPINEQSAHLYYSDWLESLPEPIAKDMKKQGYEFCLQTLNFKRFFHERNDRGMEEYMRENLTEEQYQFWKNPSQS